MDHQPHPQQQQEDTQSEMSVLLDRSLCLASLAEVRRAKWFQVCKQNIQITRHTPFIAALLTVTAHCELLLHAFFQTIVFLLKP